MPAASEESRKEMAMKLRLFQDQLIELEHSAEVRHAELESAADVMHRIEGDVDRIWCGAQSICRTDLEYASFGDAERMIVDKRVRF